MPWILNKLSYVQVDSFPQNEIARNRISGEKSEFDNNASFNSKQSLVICNRRKISSEGRIDFNQIR